MTTPSRTPSTALQWFTYNAANESAILDMANSRQIALRTRLRNHYWLTDCKPIGQTTIALIRKKMAMIDERDVMTEAEVTEVLSNHFGFIETDDGLVIPDLIEAREAAISSAQGRRERASAGGKARAGKASLRTEGSTGVSKPTEASGHEDF